MEELGLSNSLALLTAVFVIIAGWYYWINLDYYHPVPDLAYTAKSIYEFSYIDIDGMEQSMEKYRGHVLIIANVASKCGLTCENYNQLTELYDKYSESHGLRILAFPCNQFLGQEPKTESQIKEFVKKYNVNYDMSSKVEVNGPDTHLLWKYLKKQQGGVISDTIKWNFTKFLIDREGNVVSRYAPIVSPKRMEREIKELLGIGTDT